MREIVIDLPFKPRQWQIPLLRDKSPRIVAVIHRRAGKSYALLWKAILRCLSETKSLPRVVYLLPYNVQWQRTGLWQQLVEFVRPIPGVEVRKSESSITFPNGATFVCGGADNQDSWRGGYADMIVCDEADDMPPSIIPLVIEPMLADRDGVLVRSGTPKGNGLLEVAYNRAKTTPGYSAYLLDWTKTGALTPEAIERLKSEMTSEEFAQELECSFAAPNSGSYYGNLLHEAELEGRITRVPYDPKLPVTTAWDLGMDDCTSIWFAQITRGREWRIIDHLSSSGAGADHYVRELASKPYTYACHLLPHDIEVEEWGTGRSRREVLESFGMRNIVTVPSYPGAVADGINAVRLILPLCWFDEEKCAAGLKALRAYHREWNEGAQTWRTNPKHDWSSHDADSFRMLAMGAKEPRPLPLGDRYERAAQRRPVRRASAWAA